MSTGNQFALIPWRAQIRSGGLRAWPDAAVSILPVLAVHESPLLEAWPSQTRIASLAGVSKTTLGAGLRFLVEQGWISLTKRKTFRAWHTVYRMEYLHYRKGYPAAASLFLALPYALVLSGVWGKMSGATKRLYPVCWRITSPVRGRGLFPADRRGPPKRVRGYGGTPSWSRPQDSR